MSKQTTNIYKSSSKKASRSLCRKQQTSTRLKKKPNIFKTFSLTNNKHLQDFVVNFIPALQTDFQLEHLTEQRLASSESIPKIGTRLFLKLKKEVSGNYKNPHSHHLHFRSYHLITKTKSKLKIDLN